MDNQNISLLVKSIVTGQKVIIGQMAIDQANQVPGLKVSPNLETITINGDSNEILHGLVNQYKQLFGQASVEACKDSIKEILPKISAGDIPDFLR